MDLYQIIMKHLKKKIETDYKVMYYLFNALLYFLIYSQEFIGNFFIKIHVLQI